MYVSLVHSDDGQFDKAGGVRTKLADTHGVIETKWDGAVHLNFFAKGLKVINA